ncbi:MAG: hypothetical protein EA398_02090 [Deltaproteobacteria bacterium]|nr:MAG: hypothetical protein EA398_02090 [Deltaproteobacteria bacterium]
MTTMVNTGPAVDRALALHIIERLGSAGVPPVAGIEAINVGNATLLRLLREEYFETLLRVGSAFKLVEAHYGGGKTHFLRMVQRMAWQYGFAAALVELSPRECPYDDPRAVYGQVARRLGLQPASPLEDGASGIAELVRRTVDERIERALEESDEHGERELRWVVQRAMQRELRRAPCESPSYRSAVMALVNATLEDDHAIARLAEGWLLGESPPMAELRPLGINEAITRSNGFTMLRSLTQMVVALGHAGTALLFDEVDRTLSVSSRRTEAIGDNLRQVIDLCGEARLPRTLFLYAVPPEFMRQVVPDYPALEQRLRSPVAFSERSPQAPIIPLDRLDLAPQALLEALAERIRHVFEQARGVSLDASLQAANATRLAEACTLREFDVNHRRLFVKVWVAALQGQWSDGQRLLTPAEVDALLEGQRSATVADAAEAASAFDDF